jgi:hypothetical protein
MSKYHYSLFKNHDISYIVSLDPNRIKGFLVKPKNKLKSNGIKVNNAVIIEPSLIDKVLKRKNKKRLDFYIEYIMQLLEDDDASDEEVSVALSAIDRYQSIIRNKYRIFLEEKYINELLKKTNFLKEELKKKKAIMNLFSGEKSRKSR